MTASDLWGLIDSTNCGIPRRTWDDIVAGTEAVALKGDVLILRAPDERKLEWLEHRLKRSLERGAKFVTGRPIQVEFTLNGYHSPVPETAPTLTEAEPVAVANPQSEIRLIELNHEAAGWARHSHYLARFLRAHIGAAAFDVWDFIRSHCKDGSLNWTPARDFTGRALARGAACSYQRVVGVWRSCAEFDRRFFEDGEIISCCKEHPDSQMATTKPTEGFAEGRPTCRHWVPGALEVLEAEGLAAWRKHGDTPRSTFYTIQVYQHPPILTPAQAAKLDSVARIEHRDFLAGLLSSHGLNLIDWEAVKAYSLLAVIDQAAWLSGLALDMPKAVFTCNAHNQIFFESRLCANEQEGADGSPDCT